MEEILVPLFLFGGLVLIFAGWVMTLIAAVAWAGIAVLVAGLLCVLIGIGMMIAY